jgi:hypothetical protein
MKSIRFQPLRPKREARVLWSGEVPLQFDPEVRLSGGHVPRIALPYSDLPSQHRRRNGKGTSIDFVGKPVLPILLARARKRLSKRQPICDGSGAVFAQITAHPIPNAGTNAAWHAKPTEPSWQPIGRVYAYSFLLRRTYRFAHGLARGRFCWALPRERDVVVEHPTPPVVVERERIIERRYYPPQEEVYLAPTYYAPRYYPPYAYNYPCVYGYPGYRAAYFARPYWRPRHHDYGW